MRQNRAFIVAALAAAVGGCAHAPPDAPPLFCMASRTDATGSFYASENGAAWSQVRRAPDHPFSDPPYISIRYALELQGNGEARSLRSLVGSHVSVSFGRRFRERDLPLHRGGLRQRRRAEARVTDEAVSVELERDGWAFFPLEGMRAVLRNEGDLELGLYDDRGRRLHREFVSAAERGEIERTLHELAQQALVMARDREANCRLVGVEDEVVLG